MKELRHSKRNPGDLVTSLLAEFGRNLPESTEIDATMRNAIAQANSGNWDNAARIFRDVLKGDDAYDVPYIWLADLLQRSEGPSKAVAALQAAAKKCRRKSHLLEEAAEVCLLECGEVRRAIHLFAQCIAAMEAKPLRGQITRQRAFLFMKEIFTRFGDSIGAQWADSMQSATHLDVWLLTKIRDAVAATPTTERSLILDELPEIRDRLCKMFPL